MPLSAFDVCILGLASGSTIRLRETQTGRNELRKFFISDLSRTSHCLAWQLFLAPPDQGRIDLLTLLRGRGGFEIRGFGC